MKKMLLLAIAAVTALSMVPAHASFSESGTIAVANPASRVLGGATEITNPCGAPDPDLGSLQGVDGYWITLPEGAAGLTATLTANAPNDVDAWFYDEGCGLMPSPYPMATTDPAPNGDEQGVIPDGAFYVVIDLYAGANATFTFSIA